MSDQSQAAPIEQEVESAPQTSEEFFAEALQDLEQGEVEEQSAPAEPAISPEAVAPEEGKAEPEVDPALDWVRRVDGLLDEEGNVVTDRLAGQAYNLNKQNQELLRKQQEILQVLENPVVKAAIQRAYVDDPKAEQPAEERSPKKEPETSEEILAEFVEGILQKHPVIQKAQQQEQELQTLRAWRVQSEIEHTKAALTQEFPEWEQHAEEISTHLAGAAQKAGITQDQLIQYLAFKGELLPTLRNTAQAVMFPKINQEYRKLTQAQKAALDQKQQQQQVAQKAISARLPRAGGSVSTAPKQITGWEDAIAAAEEELGAGA